jgi:hypothetical protein
VLITLLRLPLGEVLPPFLGGWRVDSVPDVVFQHSATSVHPPDLAETRCSVAHNGDHKVTRHVAVDSPAESEKVPSFEPSAPFTGWKRP